MAASRGPSLTSRAKLIGGVVALVILVVFIALNTEDVDVDFLVATVNIQLGVALLLTALLGFVVGYFMPQRR